MQAVRAIDLTIVREEVVALLGFSGGKSTTIDMLLGLCLAGRRAGVAVRHVARRGGRGPMLQTGALIDHPPVPKLVTMVASLYPRPLEVDEVLPLTGTSELAGRRTAKLSGGHAAGAIRDRPDRQSRAAGARRATSLAYRHDTRRA